MNANEPTKAGSVAPGGSPRIYTIEDVATMFQVHRNSVRAWIRTGKLPAHRLGHRTVRITQEGIDVFLAGGGPGRVYETGPRRRAGTRAADGE